MSIGKRLRRAMAKQRQYSELLRTKMKDLGYTEIRRCAKKYQQLTVLVRRLAQALRRKVEDNA